MPPFLEGASGYLWQQRAPRRFKGSSREIKCLSRAVLVLARMQAWVETASPLPLIAIDRDAGALAYRAHVNIAEIDVPGDLMRVVGAAAGESGDLP
jgi:hypothetical protein